MEKGLADLERIQTRILQRISDLELLYLPQNFSRSVPFSDTAATALDDNSTTEGRLSAILRFSGVKDFLFKRVPSNYYSMTLEARRDVLDAASIHHLCKSIVLVNTQAPSHITDCSDRNNSKYYVVVVQYTARFNAEAVKNFLYALNDGKISKKKFNVRLAPEETSVELTGFEHNGVTCIGMKTDIPLGVPLHGVDHQIIQVILDEAIVKLVPDFFWLGGGEIDLKLGIRTSEFINFVKPLIINCAGS